MDKQKIKQSIVNHLIDSGGSREEVATKLESLMQEINDEVLKELEEHYKPPTYSESKYKYKYKKWPSDFDGAHHVAESRKGLPYDAMGDYSNIEPSKEQERLDNFNKNNPTSNLQDLM